jgi:hypothetical protein
MLEFTFEPIEPTVRLYFPPNRPGVARLHSTYPNCTAGAAGGRSRSEHWSPQTWPSKDGALTWARKHHLKVEHCAHCFT